MNNQSRLAIAVVAVALAITGCGGDQVNMPRPKGWPRIALPGHGYHHWENGPCPFSFDLPVQAKADSMLLDSCWINFYYPDFDYRWHITYRSIPGSGKTRQQHFQEYHTLVYKHIQKSTRINETPLHNANGDGIFYELYGSIGVPAQFIFGDDKHLVMASFYFPTAVNGDSLAPVIGFVKEDMQKMIESIKWK